MIPVSLRCCLTPIRKAFCVGILMMMSSQAVLAQDLSAPHGWTLAETDCQIPARNWIGNEAVDEYHSAPDSSHIHFKASWGTQVMISRPVDLARVIGELKPSVWVKGTRPGIQLYARVVLPRTSDPLQSGPMTVLLPGPVYQSTGRWEKLDFADVTQNLPRLLEEAVWKLRAHYDQRVDSTGAYVDKLVLNIYTGLGTSSVWIDDVEMQGTVSTLAESRVHRDSQFQQVAWEQELEFGRRPALTQVNSTILEVRDQPFFVRSIQHNGEPFELLRNLGFNTIELPVTATIQQLRQAERLDMWVVCPPPQSAGLEPVSAEFDRVLAWSMGDELDHTDVERIAATGREVEHSDFRENRPRVAFADSALSELARHCDILSVGVEPIGGSFILSQYSDWLEQRARLAEKSMPMWASIQTQLPSTIRAQAAAMANGVPPLPVEAAQIKYLTYEAIAGGARGLRFLSYSRLDAADPVARLRSLTLRWLNAHLRQLEPWAAGGAVINRTQSNDRERQLTTLATSRARLILIQHATQLEQLVAGDSPLETFQFSDHSLSSSEGVFHLTESGVMPLDQGRVMAGNEMTIENCGPLEAVLVTQEPVVINRIAETYVQSGDQSQPQMHLEIVRQWMVVSQLIVEQLNRIGRTEPAASGAINEANNALRQAQALIDQGSAMTANELLCKAEQLLASARRTILSSAREPFVSSTSSPLLSHVSLVPLHFGLVNRIDPQGWQANGLAGGDFENLEHMTSNGWENHRANDERINTHVELATASNVDGERALLMDVQPSRPGADEPIVDRTPLWIRSGPVPVKAGQLVRIHGWIRVDQPIRGSLDGLMIMDSIGGNLTAERVNVTSGWQEFSMYRCPARDIDLQLTFALTGYGQVLIDEVQVRVLDLSEPVRQARKGQ
ncbi:MAG: hypothetical protein ACR2NP_15800 [Pirellulaceae bacterium]